MVIGCRRRSVGDARGGDHAGGHADAAGEIQRRDQRRALRAGAVAATCTLVDADEAGPGLHSGHDRGHGAGRIRRLLVGSVDAAERGIRELFEAEAMALAIHAQLLPGIDMRGGHGGEAHAIAQKHDDVARALRPAGIAEGLPRSLCASREPALRGFHTCAARGRRGVCHGRIQQPTAHPQQAETDSQRTVQTRRQFHGVIWGFLRIARGCPPTDDRHMTEVAEAAFSAR